MIGDFTNYRVKFRRPTLGTSYECEIDGRMPDFPKVERWRTVSFWMFLLSLLFCLLLYFITSLDLGPVQMASARVYITSGDKSSGGGVSPCAGSAKWLPYGTDRLWDIWVRKFAYVER